MEVLTPQREIRAQAAGECSSASNGSGRGSFMSIEPSEKASSGASQSTEQSHMEEAPVGQEAAPYQSEWCWWHFLLLLALIGPVLAPLFRAIGIAPFTSVADFIYHIGEFVDPLPTTAIPLFGYPMAISPLCYSALIAITACALSYPAPKRFWALWRETSWYLQLGAILLLVIPWLICFRLQPAGNLPAWQLLMLPVGLVGGVGVALLAQVLAELFTSPGLAMDQS